MYTYIKLSYSWGRGTFFCGWFNILWSGQKLFVCAAVWCSYVTPLHWYLWYLMRPCGLASDSTTCKGRSTLLSKSIHTLLHGSSSTKHIIQEHTNTHTHTHTHKHTHCCCTSTHILQTSCLFFFFLFFCCCHVCCLFSRCYDDTNLPQRNHYILIESHLI